MASSGRVGFTSCGRSGSVCVKATHRKTRDLRNESPSKSFGRLALQLKPRDAGFLVFAFSFFFFFLSVTLCLASCCYFYRFRYLRYAISLHKLMMMMIVVIFLMITINHLKNKQKYPRTQEKRHSDKQIDRQTDTHVISSPLS